MHPAFARVDHRPWPLPRRPWIGRQTWHDLLFAHWPVPAAVLRRLVPASLEVQEFEATSWVGVVPFRMSGVMLRGLPSLPWVSAFPELNLRLYVERDGRPGVWFLSLDATQPLAVWAARKFAHLPYFRAKMKLTEHAGEIVYSSERLGTPPVRFGTRYRPTSEPYEARPGTLERWLTERYCLYSQAPDGSLHRCEIHHVPWPLQRAEATIGLNELGHPHGLALDGPPTLLHFARRLDMVAWPLERVAERCRTEEPVPARVQPALRPA